MKGQSLVVQFLLFFTIGLALFTLIAGIFRLQSDIVRANVVESSRKLVGSYISSIAVLMTDSCKECDFMNYTIKLKNVATNYLLILNLSSYGLQIYAGPEGGNISISLHNLNQSFLLSGNASSAYPITLTLNKTQNKLEVN